MSYATVSWNPEDVQDMREGMSYEEAEAFLDRNAKYLSSRLIELGYECLENYLSMEGK